MEFSQAGVWNYTIVAFDLVGNRAVNTVIVTVGKESDTLYELGVVIIIFC